MWIWNKRKGSSPELEALRRLENAMQGQNELNQAVQEQLGKLARLQYRNGQETSALLEQLGGQIRKDAEWRDTEADLRREQEARERVLQTMTDTAISWLDDLDAVIGRLHGEEQADWSRLLRMWCGQITDMLALAGIHELQVLGSSFDPGWCEAIGTRPRELSGPASAGNNEKPSEARIPYQVVEVVRRGFAMRDGALLRKAQVITLEEKSAYDESRSF
ncbi:nucleotide exchange factor GrpE [Cohnella fermenti]|nr:nucleotide exchange factor GrpE [Cohnella fermenti]